MLTKHNSLLCIALSIAFLLITFPAQAYEKISSDLEVDTKSHQINLTKDEQDWIKSHPRVTVAVKRGWMPIEFQLESESHRGLSIDYLARISRITNLEFKLIDYSDDIDSNTTEMISSVSGNSLKNSNFHILNVPQLSIPNAVYINKKNHSKFKNIDLNEFQNIKVAIYKHGALAKKIREAYPNIKLIYVDIADEAFEYLKNNEIDAYIGNELVIDYHIEFHRLGFAEKAALTPFNSEVFMAVRNDLPYLSSVLEKSLVTIGENNSEIVEYWKFKTTNDEPLLKQILIAVVVVFVMVLLWTFHLKRKSKLQDTENRQQIWRKSNYDGLTNLPNRHLLVDSLESVIADSIKANTKIGIFFIDLDNFKDINDASGHATGDKLLQEASIRILNCVRENDFVARSGSDEFVVIVQNVKDLLVLEGLCQKILNVLRLPFQVENELLFISGSIGIAVSPDDSLNAEELLKFADQAMREVKKNAKSAYKFFCRSFHLAKANKLTLINDLRSAVQLNQLELHYQPVIRLADKNIVKAEALIRWNHPIRGMVRPDEFIAIAEESGLIIEIGQWIFKQVISDFNVIKRQLGINLQIGINVSPVQFNQPNVLTEFVELLQAEQIQPSNICLEITEGILLETSLEIEQIISVLKKAGVKLSIDDFGTGYSALAYLKKFDIDFLKIDKSFTKNIETDTYDQKLCSSIIQMAKQLEIKSIAEGVEKIAQEDILKKLGCDYVQGYLYSRPQSLKNLLQMMENKS